MEMDDSDSALAYIYGPKTVLGQLPHHFQSHLPYPQLCPIHNFTLFLVSSTMASSADQTTAESQDTSCSNTVFSETRTSQTATNAGNETKPQNKDDTLATLCFAIYRVQEHMNNEGVEPAMQPFKESITNMSTAIDALTSVVSSLGLLSLRIQNPTRFNATIERVNIGSSTIALDTPRGTITHDTARGTRTASTLPSRKKHVKSVKKQWKAVKTAAHENYVKTSIDNWPNEVKEQYESLGELVAGL